MLVAMLAGLITLVMVTREADGVTVIVDAVGVIVTVPEAGHVEPVAREVTVIVNTLPEAGVTVIVDAVGVIVTVPEAGHVEPVAREVTVIVEGATTLPEAVIVAVT